MVGIYERKGKIRPGINRNSKKERSEKGRNYPANWNSKEGEQRKQKGGNYLRNDTTKEYKFLN